MTHKESQEYQSKETFLTRLILCRSGNERKRSVYMFRCRHFHRQVVFFFKIFGGHESFLWGH